MKPRDQQLRCVECARVFTFTVAQQERFEALGFPPPKRCMDCRRVKRRRVEEYLAAHPVGAARRVGDRR